MDFDEARNTVLPFGKFKGMKLKEIRDESGGLRYLDWLLGQDWFEEKEDLFEAVTEFLEDPNVARELRRELGD
jgi:uncharacterized protein (DUF3820 family)